jgi:hypothetical protein
MTLPIEYQNLIARSALEVVEPTPGAVSAFLLQAENYMASANQIDPKLAIQVFTNAMRDIFNWLTHSLSITRFEPRKLGETSRSSESVPT